MTVLVLVDFRVVSVFSRVVRPVLPSRRFVFCEETSVRRTEFVDVRREVELV